MPFHQVNKPEWQRVLVFLALVLLMAAVELYRQWKGGYAATGVRQ